jgi:hypothetical protein
MAKDPAKWNCLSLLNYALGAVKIVGSAILVLIIPDCVESTAYIFPAISLSSSAYPLSPGQPGSKKDSRRLPGLTQLNRCENHDTENRAAQSRVLKRSRRSVSLSLSLSLSLSGEP